MAMGAHRTPHGTNAVIQTVYFTVTVRSEKREGRWITRGLQTGLLTVGSTRTESEARNGRAHVLLVQGYKKAGYDTLHEFMAARSIEYRIGDELDRRGAPSVSYEDADRDLAFAA